MRNDASATCACFALLMQWSRLLLLGLTMLIAACVLPEIERGAKSTGAADAGAELSDPQMPAEVVDPRWDPANRYEDYATFQSLLPKEHLFAEWRMPDTQPAPARSFSVSGNVLTDSVTKLRWQHRLPEIYPDCKGRHETQSQSWGEGSGCSWIEAQQYCASKELANELGAGTWRLPTRIELETLLDHGRAPTIAPILESSQDDFYWTSSPVPNPSGLKLAWAVDFTDGYSYMSGRYKPGRVRCVSSEQASGGREPNYELQQKVVVDWTTQLTWQKSTDDAVHTWEEARDYCQSLPLELGGWRLPALKELLTIVDTRRHMPAIETKGFLQIQPAAYWTSTAFPRDTQLAYRLEFANGGSGYSDRADKHYVRCVR